MHVSISLRKSPPERKLAPKLFELYVNDQFITAKLTEGQAELIKVRLTSTLKAAGLKVSAEILI